MRGLAIGAVHAALALRASTAPSIGEVINFDVLPSSFLAVALVLTEKLGKARAHDDGDDGVPRDVLLPWPAAQSRT